MNWKELCRKEIEDVYRITGNLIDLVDEYSLDWQPEEGNNWLNMGQLLYHITESCGMNVKCFVTGEWNFPASEEPGDESVAEILSAVARHPSVVSVAEAHKMLNDDKQIALDSLDKVTDEELSTKMVKAPWEEGERPLGYHIFYMIDHLKQHKGQLYYYLKLQGKDVNSTHLWG